MLFVLLFFIAFFSAAASEIWTRNAGLEHWYLALEGYCTLAFPTSEKNIYHILWYWECLVGWVLVTAAVSPHHLPLFLAVVEMWIFSCLLWTVQNRSGISSSTIFWRSWFYTIIWFQSACRSPWSLSSSFRPSSSTGSALYWSAFTTEFIGLEANMCYDIHSFESNVCYKHVLSWYPNDCFMMNSQCQTSLGWPA